MAERVSGRELIDQVNRSYTKAITISNAIGATIVFVFLTVLLPLRHPAPLGRVLAINLPPALVFLVVASWATPRVGRALTAPRLQWLKEDRVPTPAEQRAALRNRYLQLKVTGAVWLLATMIFGPLNLYFSAEVAWDIAVGMVMGGLVTCSVSYLLGERIVRPVTARALEHGVPLRPVAPGVIARTVLAWATATAIPVLAIGDTALGMITGDVPKTTASAEALVFLAAVGLLVGAMATVMAAKGVAEPIRSVRRALAAVEEGRTDVQVEVNDASEVGLLQAGFNQMAAGLRERERMRDLFGRHVGEDVAHRALEAGVELGGEVREAAVLFVDVVGSTALAIDVEPQEVVKRLNAFFGIVLSVVHEHDGWVNKFEGDAALCVFGVPTPLHDPAACALAAARELCTRLRESPLEAAIGVSAGHVVAGNVGAAERFEYTVIGDPVNEAARLTEVAKQHSPRLVASGRALGRADSEESSRWQLDGEATLRGRDQPTVLAVPADSVEGLSPAAPREAQRFGATCVTKARSHHCPGFRPRRLRGAPGSHSRRGWLTTIRRLRTCSTTWSRCVMAIAFGSVTG